MNERMSPASSVASSQEHSPVYPGGKAGKKRSTSTSGLKTLGRFFNKKGKNTQQFRANADQGTFTECPFILSCSELISEWALY